MNADGSKISTPVQKKTTQDRSLQRLSAQLWEERPLNSEIPIEALHKMSRIQQPPYPQQYRGPNGYIIINGSLRSEGIPY